MARHRDPYLAGWNAAIEAAKLRCAQKADYFARHNEEEISVAVDLMGHEIYDELRKPEPIPDDHWRRVNDGDWDYDPPRKDVPRD